MSNAGDIEKIAVILVSFAGEGQEILARFVIPAPIKNFCPTL